MFVNRLSRRINSENFVKEAKKDTDCEEDDKFSEVVGVYARIESVGLFFCHWLLYISKTTVSLVHPDWGLSVRWEPTDDTEACCEFSPANMKDTLTDPEKQVLQELVSILKLS